MGLVLDPSDVLIPRRHRHLGFPQIVPNAVIAPALEHKVIDLRYDRCGFGVGDQVIVVIRVFEIPERCGFGVILAILCPRTKGCLDLP